LARKIFYVNGDDSCFTDVVLCSNGCTLHGTQRNTVNGMVNIMATRKNGTATRNTKTAATVAAATTLDGIIALARTVTTVTYVATVAAIRTAFPVARESRNVGRTTNRRVQSFQSWTMTHNETWKLNDVQLAFVWIAEFPAAIGRVFTADPSVNVAIVRGVRRDYNVGRHCPAFADHGIGVAPSVVSTPHNGDVSRFDFGPVVAPAKIVAPPVAAAKIAPRHTATTIRAERERAARLTGKR
jgi:hypothetical protein